MQEDKNRNSFNSDLDSWITRYPPYQTTETELLWDLAALIKDYFVTTLSKNKNSLHLCLNNGQNFRLILIEE